MQGIILVETVIQSNRGKDGQLLLMVLEGHGIYIWYNYHVLSGRQKEGKQY